MKKLFKLFILVITCFFVFTLSSCKKGSHADAKLVTPEIVHNLEGKALAKPHIHEFANIKKDEKGAIIAADPCICGATYKDSNKFLGYYTFDKENKTGVLYLEGSIIPVDNGQKYEVVYETIEKGEAVVPAHGHQRDGFYFAGWYQTAEFNFGQRVTTKASAYKYTTDSEGKELAVEELEKVAFELKDDIIYAKYINLGDAGVIAVICIAIVFSMLILLCLIVSVFKYLPKKEEQKQQQAPVSQPVVSAPQKAFTMADITDEDMMVAALVATIDYHNETKQDVRVVSIKEIR